MGSSKKRKDKDREHKHKRKHRSRSKSPSERHRKKHREEKKRREKPVRNDHYDVDDAYSEEYHTPRQERSRAVAQQDASPPGGAAGHGSDHTLSIVETNKLRAKLGLKPLEMEVVPGFGDESKESKKDDIHAPPVNMAEIQKQEKLREKVAAIREKRQIQQRLGRIRNLGDSDSDEESMSHWVAKSRKIQKDRDVADKRALMLEEMDAEFGIDNLVQEEFQKDAQQTYSSKDLGGMKVQHSLERFKEGKTTILTLQDKGVLDEEGDTLVNVNLMDDEFTDKNLQRKKTKGDYKAYDDEEEDAYGMMKPRAMLSKYDEEIDGEKLDDFKLDSYGRYSADHERAMQRKRSEFQQHRQTLTLPALQVASEYYTPEEMDTKFKKVRKKVRKIRKKQALKAEDLLPVNEQIPVEDDYGSRSRGRGINYEDQEVADAEETYYNGEEGATAMDPYYNNAAVSEPMVPQVFDYGHGSAPVPMETIPGFEYEDVRVVENNEEQVEVESEQEGPEEDLTGINVEENETQQELQAALSKTRRLKQKKVQLPPEQVVKNMLIKSEVKIEDEDDASDNDEMDEDRAMNASNIVLNSTSEFCRSLGDIPTYGLAGNREEERDEILDFELELMERRKEQELEEMDASGWNEVDIDTRPVNITVDEKLVLDDEPLMTQGVGATIELAKKKGYLEKEQVKTTSSLKHIHIQAQNYAIEDKRFDDIDDKYRKRDRFSGGALMDFKEKNNYMPEVKIEYVDEMGRNLDAKAAFRQLSHRFHGKGSGKKKTEKRQKKIEEEQLMKQMSSTDTPLGTLNLLQQKQRSEKSPFVVLSGSKTLTSNVLAKPH